VPEMIAGIFCFLISHPYFFGDEMGEKPVIWMRISKPDLFNNKTVEAVRNFRGSIIGHS
jgi:hypothetical protein